MSFFEELKKRNVIRVGIAYLVGGWLLVEVASALMPDYERIFVLVLISGLPIALLISWVFEVTPEGIQKEDHVDTPEEARFKARSARKMDMGIILALSLVVAYFIFEKIWLSDVVRGNNDAIAVLPFSDMSPRRDQEYFAEGLTVELLNMLSRVADLRVTGKTSAFQFKDFQGDFSEIGKTLNVGTILEGSVRAVDNNVRITTNLIDAEQGHTLWSANYDRQLTNIFQVQDEIARAVVKALEAQLLEAEDEPTDRVVDPEAYTAYQQGAFLQSRLTVEDQQSAMNYFKQSISKDPAYAEPLVGMANANLMLALNMVAIDRDTGIGEATGYLDQAIRLNPELPDAYVAKSKIRRVNFRDLVGAEMELKRALESDPNHITALRSLATIYATQGRYDESMETLQKIINRDPLNTPAYSNYSYYALAAGNLPVAEEMIGKVLEFSPDSVFANFQLARINLAKGDVSAAEQANQLERHPVWKNIGQGMIACVKGDNAAGISIADELIEQREIFNAAEIYNLCGETEKVFELLQQAAEDRDPALTEMQLSWAMTPLRDDVRWKEIVNVMGLGS
jgi:TolB-like protein/Tfp pilus assembly protein PilF